MAPTFQIAVTLFAATVRASQAGYSLPKAAFAAGAWDPAKVLLEDAWVDTAVVSTPTLCKNLTECGWNRSIIAYADILGAKRQMFSEVADFEADTTAPQPPLQPAQVEAAVPADRLALETQAVQLSLLLGQSCTESGPRQCWRSTVQSSNIKSDSSHRALRPITIIFGETHSSRAVPEDLVQSQAPLIASLRQFRLTSA